MTDEQKQKIISEIAGCSASMVAILTKRKTQKHVLIGMYGLGIEICIFFNALFNSLPDEAIPEVMSILEKRAAEIHHV